MRRMPFVLQGDFTEFLEREFGYKKWEPPLFEVVKDPAVPLETVPLAYSRVEFLPWENKPSVLEKPHNKE